MVDTVEVSRYAFRKMMVIAALSETYMDGRVRKYGDRVIWRPSLEIVGDVLGEQNYIRNVLGPENYNVGMLHCDIPVDEVEKKLKIPDKTKRMWNKLCGDKTPHIFYGTSFFPKIELIENPPGSRIGQYHLHTGGEREPSYLDEETMEQKPDTLMVVVVSGDIDIYKNSKRVEHRIVNSGPVLSNEEIEKMESSIKALRRRLNRIMKDHVIVPHGFSYSQIFPFNKINTEDYDEFNLLFGRDTPTISHQPHLPSM